MDRRRIGAIVACGILGGLGGFGMPPFGMLPPVPTAPASPPRVVEVEIRALAFEEAELAVRVGTTVRWVNRDRVPHTTTSAAGAWDSPLLEPGDSFEFTFDEEGEYGYHCVPHPFMKAKIVVTG